jgi:hypothetical protein
VLFKSVVRCLLSTGEGHGCQTTLLRLLEDWKSALDNNCYVAAILMDLSKAFNCLPRLYDKNSESDYYFFLHQNQNIFSATLGIRIFFLEKHTTETP